MNALGRHIKLLYAAGVLARVALLVWGEWQDRTSEHAAHLSRFLRLVFAHALQ
jgi:hypothetical protein